MQSSEQSLCNRNFILASLCNLVFCLSFHMLVPVMPLFLTEELETRKSIAGIVLAMYSLGSLCIRPVSGYIIDSFGRRIVFIAFMIPFILSYFGYIAAQMLIFIAICRFIHGGAFGASQTAISTMAVDAMPKTKIGTGVGLFGTINSLSMALGPMLGLFILELYSFQSVFWLSVGLSMVACGIGLLVRVQPVERKGKIKRPHIGDMIFKPGLRLAFCFLCVCFPAGMAMNYISLYVKEYNIANGAGLFFAMHSAGLILSRVSSGRWLDKGYVARVVTIGKSIIILGLIGFLLGENSTVLFGSGFVMGVGYGLVSPSYQLMLLTLAKETQRGTANAMYFLTWDVGIGAALLFGGVVADFMSLKMAYTLATGTAIVSLIAYLLFVQGYYARNSNQ